MLSVSISVPYRPVQFGSSSGRCPFSSYIRAPGLLATISEDVGHCQPTSPSFIPARLIPCTHVGVLECCFRALPHHSKQYIISSPAHQRCAVSFQYRTWRTTFRVGKDKVPFDPASRINVNEWLNVCLSFTMSIGHPLTSSPDFPPTHTVHETFTSHGVPSVPSY